VLRPYSACKISLRIPSAVDPGAGGAGGEGDAGEDPPYGARVAFEGEKASTGWDAPPLAQWLSSFRRSRVAELLRQAAPWQSARAGPFPSWGCWAEKFPDAQFLITGRARARVQRARPNEFLHIPTGIRLTACVASVIADHFAR